MYLKNKDFSLFYQRDIVYLMNTAKQPGGNKVKVTRALHSKQDHKNKYLENTPTRLSYRGVRR
jgi:hypothetical protein